MDNTKVRVVYRTIGGLVGEQHVHHDWWQHLYLKVTPESQGGLFCQPVRGTLNDQKVFGVHPSLLREVRITPWAIRDGRLSEIITQLGQYFSWRTAEQWLWFEDGTIEHALVNEPWTLDDPKHLLSRAPVDLHWDGGLGSYQLWVGDGAHRLDLPSQEEVRSITPHDEEW